MFRQEKVNKLIKKELNNILLKEIELPPGTLATIVFVKTSADFKKATIGLTMFPTELSEEVLKLLTKRKNRLQYLLNQRLMMRSVPEIYFTMDTID